MTNSSLQPVNNRGIMLAYDMNLPWKLDVKFVVEPTSALLCAALVTDGLSRVGGLYTDVRLRGRGAGPTRATPDHNSSPFWQPAGDVDVTSQDIVNNTGIRDIYIGIPFLNEQVIKGIMATLGQIGTTMHHWIYDDIRSHIVIKVSLQSFSVKLFITATNLVTTWSLLLKFNIHEGVFIIPIIVWAGRVHTQNGRWKSNSCDHYVMIVKIFPA